MKIDNQDDQNTINSISKNSNSSNLKILIENTNEDSDKNSIINPESIIDEYKSLRTINPENIYDLMIIIEEINKKVFVFI